MSSQLKFIAEMIVKCNINMTLKKLTIRFQLFLIFSCNQYRYRLAVTDELPRKNLNSLLTLARRRLKIDVITEISS